MGAQTSSRRLHVDDRRPAPPLSSPDRAASYKDPITGTTHVYGPGDRVILGGAALEHARKNGLAPVGTLVRQVGGVDGARCMLCLCLYADAPAESPGGVGQSAGEILVAAEDTDLVRPFPIYLYEPDLDDVRQKAHAFKAWRDALFAARNDADPDRRLRTICGCLCASADDVASGRQSRTAAFDAGDSHVGNRLDRDRALSAITAYTPHGEMRYTTLVHDADDPATSDPGRCARPIIVSTTGMAGGTACYGIVPLSPERLVQSAILCAYGLPLIPAFYQALDWSRWSEYDRLVDEMREGDTVGNRAGDGIDVDSVWLYRMVTDLVNGGYRASPVDLASTS